MSDVTIERAGDKNGTPGEHGGFWGSSCPALHVRGGYFLEVKDVTISDVDIYDSRYRALGISSNSGKAVTNLKIKNLHVDGVADNEWALYVDPSAVGNGTYENVTTENCTEPAIGNGSRRFTLTDIGSGIESIPDDLDAASDGDIIPLFNMAGREIRLHLLPSGPRKIIDAAPTQPTR